MGQRSSSISGRWGTSPGSGSTASDSGIVWTAPGEVEVTGSLHVGRNRVEVDVANSWMNRLIAEAGIPDR